MEISISFPCAWAAVQALQSGDLRMLEGSAAWGCVSPLLLCLIAWADGLRH